MCGDAAWCYRCMKASSFWASIKCINPSFDKLTWALRSFVAVMSNRRSREEAHSPTLTSLFLSLSSVADPRKVRKGGDGVKGRQGGCGQPPHRGLRLEGWGTGEAGGDGIIKQVRWQLQQVLSKKGPASLSWINGITGAWQQRRHRC